MRQSYHTIRALRLSDDVWQALKRLKKRGVSWNTFFVKLLKEKKIVIQNSRDKKQEDKPKNKEIVIQNEEEKPQIVLQSQANKILDLFYTINKTIDYKKPFERRAADELIKIYGLERVLKVAKFAIQVRGMQFAPRISKPSDLKNKWADLETFALTKKNEVQAKQIIEV
jgi:hypothetical protein